MDPEDELVIVAPAVEQSPLEWLANDEDDARARAGGVAEAVGERAPTEEQAVEVKPDPPLQAVEDSVAEHRPDLVVVALREGEEARWLERGELDRLPDEIAGVPVVRLTASGG